MNRSTRLKKFWAWGRRPSSAAHHHRHGSSSPSWGKPCTIRGTSPLLGQALQNPWVMPALGSAMSEPAMTRTSFWEKSPPNDSIDIERGAMALKFGDRLRRNAVHPHATSVVKETRQECTAEQCQDIADDLCGCKEYVHTLAVSKCGWNVLQVLLGAESFSMRQCACSSPTRPQRLL